MIKATFTDFSRGIYNEEIKLKQSTFPAGERYIKIEEESYEKLRVDLGYKYCNIVVSVTCLGAMSDTIMDLMLFANCVQNIDSRIQKVLNFSYLPYGRQDRVCSPGESDSLKVFMSIISKAYDKISILDAHNAKFPYPENVLLMKPDYNNFIPVFNNNLNLKEFIREGTAIVQVDAGARDRCIKAAEELRIDNIIVFDKQRIDGRITHKLKSDSLMYSPKKIKTFIVIDDICDGGGTFLSVASELNKINTEAEVILVITHGIFSAGFDKLREYYREIFVHNNSFNLDHL